MIWFLYNVLFVIGFTLLLPKYLLRMRRRGGYARNFAQRFGRYDAATAGKLAGGGRIWVHAVSVGELFVAQRFMAEWRQREPAARFVLSVNTSTAHAQAEARLDPRDVLLYFPVDFPPFVRRVLDRVRPRALVLAESELWPNLIRLARARGIPLALINGRISDRSFPRYRLVRGLTRRILPLFDVFCAQSLVDANRLTELGAPAAKVRVTGSTKYDLPPLAAETEQKARAALAAAGFGPERTILLGGSTWPGEEAALLDLYRHLKPRFPALALVLVPRHFERAAGVVREIESRGLRHARRSALPATPPADPDVLLVDTTGELRAFYACADAVFVGKSLCSIGGQNPIEPAQAGRAILAGPHMENFAAIMDDFRAAQALVEVRDATELEERVAKFLADPAARRALGGRAARLVAERSGAIVRTVDFVKAGVDHA